MKILFVDNTADLQQKWLDPLRAEGWGALRARSSEDAERMLHLHGDSIEVVVISETLVRWAENHDYAFVVLTHTWKDKEVLTHQNSARSAFYYQPYQGRVQDLQAAIRSFRSGGPLKGDPSEGTQWTSTKTIALEDFTGVLTKPEVTKTHSEFSIKLEAPSVLFGGEPTNAGQSLPIPTAIPEPPSDSTRISIEAPSLGPRSIEISLDSASVPPPQPDLPEVMEVKLDLEAPTRFFTPEMIRAETAPVPSTPTAAEPTISIQGADQTMVLESTTLDLSQGVEVSQPISAKAEELELLDELSIQDEVRFQEAVGGSAPTSRSVPLPPPPPVVRVIEGDEALKNYLALREQDVAVLTGQVRSSQERIAQLEMQLKVEKARGTELQHVVQKQEQQIKNFDQDKKVESEVLYRQVEDLNQQLQERTNKAHTIEAKLRLTTDEVNKVKDRVRVDIRRIRVREKELESQLEILKKDSAALLQARDEKIIELKRKLDLIEFNMELIQEQYSKERQSTEDLRNRLKDAAKAMRQAGGLLEQ